MRQGLSFQADPGPGSRCVVVGNHSQTSPPSPLSPSPTPQVHRGRLCGPPPLPQRPSETCRPTCSCRPTCLQLPAAARKLGLCPVCPGAGRATCCLHPRFLPLPDSAAWEGLPWGPLPTWWHLCPKPLPPLMVASVFIKLAHHKCPASGTHLACCNQSLALQEEVTMMLHSPAQSASASAQEVPSPTLHQPTDLTVPSPHPAHTEAPASPAIFKAGLNSCKVLAEFPAHSHHKHCPSSKSRWLPSVYHIRRNDPPICGTRSNL